MDLSPDEDNFQGRLLHQAALWDNVELVQELLASGASPDARDSCGRTALHAAALAERSQALVALCAAGAALDACSDLATGGKSALHVAAERGHVENVRVLLGAGASPGVTDAAGDTPIALAERHAHRHAAWPLREAMDALERERLSQHAALRELVASGDCAGLKQRLASLGAAAGLVVNMAPGGASTLLYVASEAGLTSAVSSLLSAGADGRAHPVTRYGPLYAACYHGHVNIAKMLLDAFPEAVQQETVEKWLPVHAACIGGHAQLVTLLLDHHYPHHVMQTYTDSTGEWQYSAAFDVNAVDVSGQSPLYVACTLGNLPVVEALLSHTVTALPVPGTTSNDTATDHRNNAQEEEPSVSRAVVTPQRSGISLGIHAIVSKLTGSNNNEHIRGDSKQLCPVLLNSSRGADTCVSCVVRGGHVSLLKRLLSAGADANATAATPHDLTLGPESTKERRRSRSASAALGGGRGSSAPSPGRPAYNNDRESPWTALSIAARAKNVQMVELLLQHGATDPHCRAIRETARHSLTDLLAKLLATKAYPDPDYKLNKSTISEALFHEREGDSTLTYSALCPTTPVMINWRELKAQISHIRMSWIRTASLRVNTRLSSGGSLHALHAVTRLDLSNNELRVLPPEIFTMISIRYLNAAQNKLERLPTAEDPYEEDLEPKKRRKKKTRPELYSAPVLQEVYLQDNRLEELPAALFRLPALGTLDVSNNKLRSLPGAMWSAPALRDLNAALNHLRDLPTGLEGTSECSSPTQASSPSEPQLSGSPSVSNVQSVFNNISISKSSSRSPSIERSESETVDEDDDDAVPTLGNRAGNVICSEARRAHTWRGVVEGAPPAPPGPLCCPLVSLSLAHNQLVCVPAVLACRAPNLNRLNMAYNSLRSMSFVTSYPTSLRQLDLSHNEITCWPSLPQVENFGSSEGDPLACYCPQSVNAVGRPRPRSGGSVRSQLLNVACPARRHLRLEGLRTLILANNMLTRIQLTTDDDGYVSAAHDDTHTDDDDEWNGGSPLKGRLLFPLLSMLDVSSNLLKAVPPAIHELTNLSVLNISGNKDITDLPPQMGLLSRLWNLNTVGCSLQEPLRSMLACGRYKSMDIVGYLKSVLQEARPYARMKLMLVGLQGIGKTSLLECLRQESALQHRRKPTEHWAKRMGNKSSRRGNLSTVGVDIGTWVYEKHRATRGPVTFRTWDFGGQHEYYATHQYFLSRRSLYLVLWRVTDGRRGLAGALNWLRSIQARAPGSPVIMVATHYDQVANCHLPENESPECLQRLIRSSIMGAPDADKLGLPRVLDSVEVSCSTRHNIRLLADIIYSVAFSVKPPGSKEPLLQQRVPATYVALEECVTSLAAELKEPVLKHDEFKKLVTQYMQQKNHRMFRDAAELHQATMFLHENGVLLHYDDATLKELYFLKPQWLCDVLAHVVTVREINPFANNGVMKIEDLAHVFKASPLLARGDEAWSLGVSLLNKFELALCWDARLLLVPPLLPGYEPATPQLPVRSRSWSSSTRGTPRRTWPGLLATLPDRGTDSPTLINEAGPPVSLAGRAGAPLRRLLVLSYVPRGFWARLCARLLADSQLADTAAPHTLYTLPPELESEECLSRALELSWGWKLWEFGVKICCGQLQLLQLRHLPARRDALLPGAEDDEFEHPYQNVRFRVRQEGAWCELDVQSSACIEIMLPAQVCVLRRDDGLPIAGYQSISLEPNPDILAKVLALVSDHVDLLLEDWYPALGTRFVHTSEGRCLITRLVPCPQCLRGAVNPGPAVPPPAPQDQDHIAQAFRRLELGAVEPRRLRLSEESRTSDGDSGVGAESAASSRLGSVEGAPLTPPPPSSQCWAWTVEECILGACSGRRMHCAHHDQLELRHVAPDTLLLDIDESMHARWEHITRGAVAGRGAFGTVLRATWSPPGVTGRPQMNVALKALQPVPPPPNSDPAAHHAYKAAVSRWEREPSSSACRAYCGLRQELHILLPLQHPHVVPLLAVCAAPLALLLALAPMGALDGVLRTYRECGSRCGPRLARALGLQVARALEYLHARRIVYRDLKSENVLVWQMPPTHQLSAVELSAAPLLCHVKLGDYGISRLAPPSGTKGFGGTEGFMAPEIMRYNGEEEYNEKVDCFSYGMLLYEIVTGRQPFEGHEAVKEAVLEGARPSLSSKDLEYPCCMLETLRRCWAGAPALRPSAAALVSLAGAPEYAALCDAAAARPAFAAAATRIRGSDLDKDDGGGGWEVWYGGAEPERAHTLLTSSHHFTQHHTLRIPPDKADPVLVTAMCRVGNKMWVGDSAGRISVYSSSSCSLLWSVVVQEAVGGAPVCSGVAAMLPLPLLHRVAVALTCGRLFLVTSHRPEAEGSFVLTELGTATELCCLTAVPTPHGVEVWAGGDGLYSYCVSVAGVCAADTLTLTAAPRVTLLAATTHENYVTVYCDPGVCVYQYAVRSKQQVARLDCSKLVPCSESLQSIALDEHLTDDKCRVTALCAYRSEVYVGTAWGCVIVTSAQGLRPLTVFRPYEQDVRVILPLPPHSEGECGMLVTFGDGYRPLLQRYAPHTSNTTNTYTGCYCLLWRAQHWLPD